MVKGPRCGACRACGNQAELCESHIIPEWAFGGVYTNDHKFVGISATNRGKLKVEQKGYRERLLCKDCETRLSKAEGYLKIVVDELKAGGGQHVTVMRSGARSREFKVDDPTTLKICILSILWRMSISSLSEFREYQLGPYEKRISALVFGLARPIEWYEFPLCIFNMISAGGKTMDVLYTYKRGKYKNRTMYSFCLQGVSFWVIVTENEARDENLSQVALKPDGTVAVADVEITEEMIKGGFHRRIFDEDIAGFYSRHAGISKP